MEGLLALWAGPLAALLDKSRAGSASSAAGAATTIDVPPVEFTAAPALVYVTTTGFQSLVVLAALFIAESTFVSEASFHTLMASYGTEAFQSQYFSSDALSSSIYWHKASCESFLAFG